MRSLSSTAFSFFASTSKLVTRTCCYASLLSSTKAPYLSNVVLCRNSRRPSVDSEAAESSDPDTPPVCVVQRRLQPYRRQAMYVVRAKPRTGCPQVPVNRARLFRGIRGYFLTPNATLFGFVPRDGSAEATTGSKAMPEVSDRSRIVATRQIYPAILLKGKTKIFQVELRLRIPSFAPPECLPAYVAICGRQQRRRSQICLPGAMFITKDCKSGLQAVRAHPVIRGCVYNLLNRGS